MIQKTAVIIICGRKKVNQYSSKDKEKNLQSSIFVSQSQRFNCKSAYFNVQKTQAFTKMVNECIHIGQDDIDQYKCKALVWCLCL